MGKLSSGDGDRDVTERMTVFQKRSSARAGGGCRQTDEGTRSGWPTDGSTGGGVRCGPTTSVALIASRMRSTPALCWVNSQNVRDLRTPFGA